MTPKYFHKIVGIPIAIASLGVTIWLVNKWKIENQLLNASLSKELPLVEEENGPEPEAEPSEAQEASPGTSSKDAQNVSQGSSEINKGESGTANQAEKKAEEAEEEKSERSEEKVLSESSEDQTPNPDVSNEEDSQTTETTQPDTQASNTSKDSDGSTKSEKLEVDLNEEIKKLVNKLTQEGPRWMADIRSLRSVYYAHELFSVGKQLLQALENKNKSSQSPSA